ncbi:hypothetical protein AG1IA_06750 [Rhizoctonia solani AG-1 IA]|uniref:Uncharacterized protein n=1 Tax=Thanatephorus cucumeris (strain AG1-IA) TaxID=983506 RepID=L8WR43_THACA|nr:hypothetical protein AG1IA_06750 [Rhizoctonia solani AG-1 IA]
MPRAQHRLFSSRNPAIIRRHLNIMAMHGIDGLFLTRRGSEVSDLLHTSVGNARNLTHIKDCCCLPAWKGRDKDNEVRSFAQKLIRC